MLEKIILPENCIKKLNIPLNKIFSDEDIKTYKIENCLLYASINPDLMNIKKSEQKDTRYDEIHFVYLRINDLRIHSDLYRIVQKIYKMIKYQVIVFFQLNDMYKIGGSFIAPGQIDHEENIIKHFIFSQWIYENFENKETVQFYKEVTEKIAQAEYADKLYSALYTKISSLDNSIDTKNIKVSTIKKMLKKILPLDCCNKVTKDILANTFNYKIYKHSDGKQFTINENDVLKVYPIECFWHSLLTNEITKVIMEKRRISNYEDLFWNHYIDEDELC